MAVQVRLDHPDVGALAVVPHSLYGEGDIRRWHAQLTTEGQVLLGERRQRHLFDDGFVVRASDLLVAQRQRPVTGSRQVGRALADVQARDAADRGRRWRLLDVASLRLTEPAGAQGEGTEQEAAHGAHQRHNEHHGQHWNSNSATDKNVN